ncbi:hypothetical protein NQ314_011517 [Rhamnusium bicolor]|uniref:Uncharacterized protein n=1 Tax=Rhamnusium bicolor TaxID=1586634 RepID=A0AAV8XIC7_9CUCU|nr:hypothetical protein NQ314_011517 [Rhamnusium bicolor]
MEEWSESETKLTYPSENLVIAVGHAVTELEVLLPKFGDKAGVGKFAAEQIISAVDFSWFSCATNHDIIL